MNIFGVEINIGNSTPQKFSFASDLICFSAL